MGNAVSQLAEPLLIMKQHAGLYRFTYHERSFLVAVTDLLPVYLAYTSAGDCEIHSGSTLCPCGGLFSYWCLVCKVQYVWGCRDDLLEVLLQAERYSSPTC